MRMKLGGKRRLPGYPPGWVRNVYPGDTCTRLHVPAPAKVASGTPPLAQPVRYLRVTTHEPGQWRYFIVRLVITIAPHFSRSARPNGETPQICRNG